MDTTQAADTIAEPMGDVGMRFYFSEHSAKAGEPLGLDALGVYAGGRGGVVEGADGSRVDEVFLFFAPGLIGPMAEAAWATAGREATVEAHLGAADAYAADTFASLPEATLDAFNEAVDALEASLPKGRWPIVDGYRDASLPEGRVERAYRNAILLRELRGGVHTDAVLEAGLDPKLSCRLDRGGAYYALHGYGDAAELTPTEADVALRDAVEADTATRMAGLLEALSPAQREALVAGALAMHEATR